MSRNLTPETIEQIKRLISEERLRPFRALVATDSAAIDLHQATMILGAALLSITGVVEVALRNAVCAQMRRVFGQDDWLRQPLQGFAWAAEEKDRIRKAEKSARRAIYAKLTDAERHALDSTAFPHGLPTTLSEEEKAKARQEGLTIPHGQVITQLTLFFWKHLFSEHYEKTLWKRTLKRVFPNKTLRRADVAAQLEVIYQTRNRLAHHEPVYGQRLTAMVAAVDFTAHHLGARFPDPNAPFAVLLRPHRDHLTRELDLFQEQFRRLTAT